MKIGTIIRHSWWVVAFIFGCAILYEHGLKERSRLYQQLTEQAATLTKEKALALDTQERLQRQINSQNDPAWVELTLMKQLGVVPKGQKKIYFYRNNPANNLNFGFICPLDRVKGQTQVNTPIDSAPGDALALG